MIHRYWWTFLSIMTAMSIRQTYLRGLQFYLVYYEQFVLFYIYDMDPQFIIILCSWIDLCSICAGVELF